MKSMCRFIKETKFSLATQQRRALHCGVLESVIRATQQRRVPCCCVPESWKNENFFCSLCNGVKIYVAVYQKVWNKFEKHKFGFLQIVMNM